MRTIHILSAVLITSSLARAEIHKDWSEGEHLELGDKGALLACADMQIKPSSCPVRQIPRADQKVLFTYGEILVTADYYNSPHDMNQDTQGGIKNILQCAKRMLENHPQHDVGEGDYGGCEIYGFFNLPGYLEVISDNYDHFGWNNMKAYVRYHQLALDRARESFLAKKTNAPRAQELLAQALILNGFADHYLTDAFAAGHVRTPRLQIKEWAKQNLSGLFKGTRGDILAVVLHDSESRNLRTGVEQGMTVENSLGDVWFTRADQYLHVNQDEGDPVFVLPLLAVRASVRDVLVAWQTGYVADGIFPAIEYVPFSRDIPLAAKLTSQHQNMKPKELFRSLSSQLPSFLAWLFSRSDFEKMQRDLSLIFANFRRDIARDLQDHPEYRQRVPTRYLRAFLEVE